MLLTGHLGPIVSFSAVSSTQQRNMRMLLFSCMQCGLSKCHAEDEKENVDDKGKKPMREEDLPQAQAAEDDAEADDSPGSRTDMELAWENLEVAKFIYERETQGSYAKELAGGLPQKFCNHILSCEARCMCTTLCV